MVIILDTYDEVSLEIQVFSLIVGLTFLSGSCSKTEADKGTPALVVCAGLVESDCKAQDKCNVISGTELSTKETVYMGCLKDNSPDGLICNDALSCYVDEKDSRKVIRPNLCAPEDWIFVECTQEDFDQIK